MRVSCLRLHVHARIDLDFLKARFWFLLFRWSVGKRTFLACSTLFLTGQFIFSGRGCVVRDASNQKTLYLVTSVLGKLHFRRILRLARTCSFEVKRLTVRYISGRDFWMVASTGSEKSLSFHIAPFENTQ